MREGPTERLGLFYFAPTTANGPSWRIVAKKPGRMRYKPSSVPTRRRVTGEAGKAIYLDPTLPPGSRPTLTPAEAAYPRRCLPEGGRPEPRHVAAWPCARWGLPCQAGHPARGALLPHHFTLTLRLAKGGIFSVALSRSCVARREASEAGRWALPTTAVQRRSDFPPPARIERGAAFHASGRGHYTAAGGDRGKRVHRLHGLHGWKKKRREEGTAGEFVHEPAQARAHFTKVRRQEGLTAENTEDAERRNRFFLLPQFGSFPRRRRVRERTVHLFLLSIHVIRVIRGLSFSASRYRPGGWGVSF